MSSREKAPLKLPLVVTILSDIGIRCWRSVSIAISTTFFSGQGQAMVDSLVEQDRNRMMGEARERILHHRRRIISIVIRVTRCCLIDWFRADVCASARSTDILKTAYLFFTVIRRLPAAPPGLLRSPRGRVREAPLLF